MDVTVPPGFHTSQVPGFYAWDGPYPGGVIVDKETEWYIVHERYYSRSLRAGDWLWVAHYFRGHKMAPGESP